MDYSGMTFEEAEYIINNPQHVQAWDEMGGHAIYLATVACEKQIDEQVKVDPDSKYLRRRCPDCDATVEIYYEYCPFCGKKLNWYGKS